MADEHVFLSDDNLFISNAKVILYGTTYATANITSVQKRFTPLITGCPTLLVVMSALMTLGSLFTVFSKNAGAGIVMLLIFGGTFDRRSRVAPNI